MLVLVVGLLVSVAPDAGRPAGRHLVAKSLVSAAAAHARNMANG